jgi:hypothetical protein
MQRRVAALSAKDEPEPGRAYGRRNTTFARASRSELLTRFRQARRRLGEGSRR